VAQAFCPTGYEPRDTSVPTTVPGVASPICVRAGTCGSVCVPGCPPAAATCVAGRCITKPDWTLLDQSRLESSFTFNSNYANHERDALLCGTSLRACEPGAAKNGGTPEAFAVASKPEHLAHNSTTVLWVDKGTASVKARPKAGGVTSTTETSRPTMSTTPS
jgi:hypothetical protein